MLSETENYESSCTMPTAKGRNIKVIHSQIKFYY